MKKITLQWDITYPLTTKVHIKKITILQKVTNHFHLEKEIHSTQLSLAKLQHQIISISNFNLVLKKEIMYGRRLEMIEKRNLRLCLQGSSEIMLFETILALLNNRTKSRFDTDQIFLKSNFRI